jgi:exoribonuclease R
MTDAALLEHISRLPHARANFKQLVRELGAKGSSRDDLEAGLARLAERGQLIELRSGQYAVTALSREYAAGRLHMHRDGFGFLIADRPVEGIRGDIYILAASARRAMHGDRVLVKIARIREVLSKAASARPLVLLLIGSFACLDDFPFWGAGNLARQSCLQRNHRLNTSAGGFL